MHSLIESIPAILLLFAALACSSPIFDFSIRNDGLECRVLDVKVSGKPKYVKMLLPSRPMSANAACRSYATFEETLAATENPCVLTTDQLDNINQNYGQSLFMLNQRFMALLVKLIDDNQAQLELAKIESDMAAHVSKAALQLEVPREKIESLFLTMVCPPLQIYGPFWEIPQKPIREVFGIVIDQAFNII